MTVRIFTGMVLLSFFMFAGLSCKHSASQNVGTNEGSGSQPMNTQPEITFDTLVHDFGRVQQGEKVGWYFRFRNTGGSDLIITHASASCGCTVAEYNRDPVPAGGEGTVKVLFDSSGRNGKQVKTVTIESNAKNLLSELTLKAYVSEK